MNDRPRSAADKYVDLHILITSLRDRFGRMPTEDETWAFIQGDDKTRNEMWSKRGEV